MICDDCQKQDGCPYLPDINNKQDLICGNFFPKEPAKTGNWFADGIIDATRTANGIKDSGNRTEFATGAVRDTNTGACVFKHGKSSTRLFGIWTNMHTRCYNQNNKKYKNYGARGIKICGKWKNDFLSFYEWAMGNGYKKELTIDRVDNDGDYGPENCRWTTLKEQGRNKTNTLKIFYKGEERAIKEWAELVGIKYGTIRMRIRYGWTAEKALTVKDGRYDKGQR